jgi:carboxyl-terminal processing protease
MMIRKKEIILFLLFITALFSCKKSSIKDADNPSNDEQVLVNNWVYTKMKEYYLWESEMNVKNNTNLSLDTKTYFSSILVNPGVTDRFSWIQESAEELRNSLNGLSTTFGLKYSLYYINPQRTRIAIAVSYTLKNSAADKAGIQRGDFIVKVNGEDLTNSNYTTAFQKETVTLTMGNYESGEVVANGKTIKITKEQTQADALQYADILEHNNKRIGYFVYTQFLTSNDLSLNSLFGFFKEKKINELIIDLRFNPGGYISSANLLSSLIVKNPDESKLMSRQIWNSEQTDKMIRQYGKEVFNTYFSKLTNNVGDDLERVYFLVSGSSASASELLINNLKPHMNVILVGTNTYGKNVGSITIEDENTPKRWQWGIQPIVLKLVNSLGESNYGTKKGFTPDIYVNDDILPYKSFGDEDETLLNAALVHILGADVFAKTRKKLKESPKEKFTPVVGGNFSDNPLLDRKEMWLSSVD